MITDKLVNAIVSLIEDCDQVNAYPNLSGVNVYGRDSADNRSYPAITVTDNGADEHDVLDGVYTVSVELKLDTIPSEDSTNGTTYATHQAICYDLWALINEEKTALLEDRGTLNAYEGLKVFDIHENSPLNDRDDGRNSTTFTLEVVACPTYQPFTP